MKLSLTTRLDAPPGRIWEEVLTPRLLQHVAAPLVRFRPTGQLAKRWDHTILVQPSASGGTQYTDVVEVRAGMLTPFVWAFAQLFYRHRQQRWRALVERGFDYRS